MNFDQCISQLFDYSERLHAVRSDLLEIANSLDDYHEQLYISLSIKTIDLIRVMLLYEYELLDTSHVIPEEYVSSYYARRVEILVMTKEQINGYSRELKDLSGRFCHPRAVGCIDQASGVIGDSVRFLNDTVATLENEIIAAGNGHTRH